MCYSTSRKITQPEYLEHLQSGERYSFLGGELAIYKGFDHNMHLVDRPIENSHKTERVPMQWGFLPPYLRTAEDVKRFRFGYKDQTGKFHKGFTTLNATSEELLNKMYKEAALKRRCLIPVNGYYEWMHVMVVGKSGKLLKTPEKFPYYVKMREQEEFSLAAIWQPWFNTESKQTINTYAIVTTAANTLMKQIHNSKERMPTILPGDLAEAWLYNNLTDQNILDIANYQIASAEMIAIPLDKDFLKKENPHESVIYKEAPELVYG
ncbi:MAG TPA: SOS response-associated peptidase family protein [Chitinophagaceae bacterium]|nr:SOS response-associated peptidase family protein [Chitinophagaceae bacterium]